MICIPPDSYCVISNPVVRDEDGKVVLDKFGQVSVVVVVVGDRSVLFNVW